MYINLSDIKGHIDGEQSGEVTSVDFFIPGTSEAEQTGLISYELFGVPGTPDRKQKWGYVNLNAHFIMPHALKELYRVYTSKFSDFINGTVEYGITEKHQLEKVRDGVHYIEQGTGISWLYKVWDKIEWRDRAMSAVSTENSRRFFKLFKKDRIFTDKWEICPAFYRDIDVRTQKRNEINTMYVSLIGTVRSLKVTMQTLGEDGAIAVMAKVQKILENIYDFFVDKIAGTHGFMNDSVLGKNTDYASRMVITATDLNAETPDDMETSFYSSAVPLQAFIKSFSPFMVFGFIDFIQQSVLMGSNYIRTFKDGRLTRVELSPYWSEFITSENIQKLMNRYDSDRNFRLEYLKLETVEGPLPIYIYIGDDPSASEENYKPLRYCEVFYMIAHRVSRDKHIYITRYPIEDQHSVYPSRINIIPCTKYAKRGEFPRYPLVEEADKNNLDYFFVDSLRMSPLYLAALQADFDGDQTNLQGTFSDEANMDAEKELNSPANFVGVDGNPIRVFKDYGYLALYSLTLKEAT